MVERGVERERHGERHGTRVVRHRPIEPVGVDELFFEYVAGLLRAGFADVLPGRVPVAARFRTEGIKPGG